MTQRARRRLVLAAVAAGVGHLVAGAVRRHPPGGAERWRRTNYRQRPVDLAGGPAAAAGLASALLAARSPSAFLAATAAAGLGGYDDLAGHTHARGLRGHAAALRGGVVTSGMVKLVGLVVAAVASAPTPPRRPLRLAVDVVLIAGTANLVNLLDLRPGRALKAAAVIGLPLVAVEGSEGDAAAAVLGVTVALLPDDLAERQMLGDCGANAIGASLGWALAARAPALERLLAATTVVALTIVSERVSFTRVIEQQPVLAAIDRWGRRAT